MNRAQIRNAVVAALKAIAPETDPGSLADEARFREALDLDSMDFLNVLVAVHEALKVDIPEADYGKVQTVGELVGYLQRKLDASAEAPPLG